MPEQTISITPDAKLYDVLAAYPQLGAVVNDLVPSFARLTSATLRDVVSRTLTLEQAATANNSSPVTLVMTLRQAAGVTETAPSGRSIGNAPDWVKSGEVVKELDARPLLAQGHHPKAEVLQELSGLEAGQIFLLVTPFVPGPLVEMGRQQGLSTWTRQGEAGRFETYFGKLD
ncbi:MAG TPA: DUF2249 domain-containing protein [bacterium]|jgi:hypothetical protein